MTSFPTQQATPLSFPIGSELPPDTIAYGPDIADESALRLLGDISGKRVLQLGSPDGRCATALTRRGAKVIAVEPSSEGIAASRWQFQRDGARVELQNSDLADLASVRADSIDLVLAVYSLAGVDDLARVFRQAHRVLRQEAPLVFSLPHPTYSLIDPTSDEPLRIRRAYWDRTPRPWIAGKHEGLDHTHTVADLLLQLGRANFRVDTLLEPEPEAQGPRSGLWSETMRWVPATLIVRARKQGI